MPNRRGEMNACSLRHDGVWPIFQTYRICFKHAKLRSEMGCQSKFSRLHMGLQFE
jgi:hypothetical protein